MKGKIMITLMRQVALAGALLVTAGAASAGPATVTFADAEHFADMPREESKRQEILADLSDHFGKLAAKLPAGQTMSVEVLDLDLAGRSWPGIWGTRELRVLEGGADWPHIKFRYSIMQDGKVVKSGEETVQNMDYLWRLNRYSSGDTLRYEKQMLDNWFRTLTAAR
jgi:Mrp family chromosome partitioning ATPase